MGYLEGYLSVSVFFVVGVALVAGALVVSHLLSHKSDSEEKALTYECGVDPIGSAKHRYNVRYYLLAVLFIIFDVEALFLLPWALMVRQLGPVGLIEAFLFIGALLVGLLYAWRQGALEWT